MAILKDLVELAAGLLVGVAILAVLTAAHASPPQRVVSFNLCADQLVVALADPEQIAGLSPFANDPVLSAVAPAAQRFPRPDQRSEATVAMQPDLVLVGPTDRSAMRRTLAGLGIRIHEVALVTNLADARAQTRDIAVLLGHPERGERLVAEIGAAEARLAAAVRGRRATALLVERKGYATGPDSLAGALLGAAGLVPPQGAPHGLGGFVPLEKLLMLRPDMLVLHELVTEPEDQGELFLAHPALKALYPPERVLILPRKYSLCGGAALVEALDYLTAALSRPTLR